MGVARPALLADQARGERHEVAGEEVGRHLLPLSHDAQGLAQGGEDQGVKLIGVNGQGASLGPLRLPPGREGGGERPLPRTRV